MSKFRSFRLAVSLVAAGVTLPGFIATAAAGSTAEKVTICHVPPGNPSNAHTITVGAPAVDAHLAHGDHGGACAPVCRVDGVACINGSECCSGSCPSGVCRPVCSENGTACGGDGECCSGVCNAGVCSNPCAEEGAECGAGGDCCTGNCADGICGAACGANDTPCTTGSDCCSGVCTDTTKTCASDCTIGPELHGPECNTDLDCCEGSGVCILGLCYEGSECAAVGEFCDIENDATAMFCCFNHHCIDNVCVPAQ